MADPTPHERKAIRDAVVAQIVDATTAAAERVYASREKPWRPVELPGIAVRTLKESASRENFEGALVRTLTLSILAIVSVTERNDDAVDALVLQVEQAIDADTTFGGTAQDATLTETELDITDAQGNAIGAAVLTYEVEYHTAPRTERQRRSVMAASAAKTAKGAKLQVGDAATPEVFTAVAEVKSISGLSTSAGAIDVTHLESDGDEFIPGRATTGEVACEANFLAGNATQAALLAGLQAGTTHNFRVVNADAKGFEFKGFASGFDVKMSLGEAQALSFKVKIAGKISVIA